MGFEVRPDIAEALSEVDGVTGYTRRPSAPRVGDAWPKWSGDTHVAPGAFETTWQIVVLLPNDEAAQEEWIVARRVALVEALAAVAWVVGMEPGVSADSPALLINCRE